MQKFAAFLTLMIVFGGLNPADAAGPYPVRLPSSRLGVDLQADNVVGRVQHYTIKKGDSLLELARDYGLGYHDLAVLYRQWDPFIPPPAPRRVPVVDVFASKDAGEVLAYCEVCPFDHRATVTLCATTGHGRVEAVCSRQLVRHGLILAQNARVSAAAVTRVRRGRRTPPALLRRGRTRSGAPASSR